MQQIKKWFWQESTEKTERQSPLVDYRLMDSDMNKNKRFHFLSVFNYMKIIFSGNVNLLHY